MTRRRETVEYCDNPKCDYSEIVTPDEPATGFHFGKGFWILGGGGPIPAVYAHSEECILPAIQFKIKEEL